MRHYEEPTTALCRTCQRPFCSRCLVFAFGPDKPPYCVGCALNASGVRNGGKVAVRAEAPKVDKKLVRAQRKAEKAAAKAGAKAAKAAGRDQAGPPAPVAEAPFGAQAARPSNVPGPSQLRLATGREALGMHPHV